MADAATIEETRSSLSISGELTRAVLYNNAADARSAMGFGPAVLMPVGTVVPYAGSDLSTPAGWLFCGGQAVSRTTYAALFSTIGTTYGAGDGSTTFNIPDLRGRVLAGKDNMAGSAANRLTSGVSGVSGTTLGASGGDERIQNHTHTFSGTTSGQSADHSHNFNPRSAGGWNSGATQLIINAGSQYWGLRSTANNGDGGTVGATYGVSSDHSHTYSGTTSNHNQTSGGASQNVQPTLVTNYIIKAIADTVTGYAGTTLSGAAGGDLTGTYPNPSLTTISNVPVYNSNSSISMRTSNVERLGIDASGRVRMPYQPIASVYRTSSLAAGNNIGWTGSYVNVGGMYPGSGGVNFTVPVSGNYLFCVQAMSDNNAASIFIDLYKNGVRVDYLRAYNYSSANGHKHISFQIVLSASANDYFYFRNEGTTLYGDGAGYSNAIVMLVS